MEEEEEAEVLSDWASQMTRLIHQRANKNAFNRLNSSLSQAEEELIERKIEILNRATEHSDSPQFQNGESSFRHAMRNDSETIDQAREAADEFIRTQLNRGKMLLAEGKFEEAYFEFGIGLHTLQDATSPAHSNFQEWSGHENRIEIVRHVVQEVVYPGRDSNLQRITNQYIDWFEDSNSGDLPAENLFNNIQHD